MAPSKSTAAPVRKLNPSTITSLDRVDVPDWFLNAAEELSPARKRWIKALPPITLRSTSTEAEIPDLARPWIISALIHSEKEGARHDLVDLVKRYALPASLDAWMKELLSVWKANHDAASVAKTATPATGSLSEKPESATALALDRDWVLTAAGGFGGDQTALCLQACVREWVKDKKSALAVRAVDVLGRIGSKVALEHVSTLSAVTKSRVVADTAMRVAETKAGNRGLTREQMEDSHTPTCDFGVNGERIFLYGRAADASSNAVAPREFHVKIRKDLTLALLDSTGKQLKSMPKPGKADDAQIAAASLAAWSDLKTGFKRIIRSQIKRFEQAMITGRSWSFEDFQTHILRHPIVSRFAQTLIWQISEESTPFHPTDSGKSRFARLTEDLTFADSREDSLIVLPEHRIRVAHPLSFQNADLRAWGEILSDYLIVQPFSQLARHAYTAAANAGPGSIRFSLVPPSHTAIKPGVLYGVLDNDGWRLGDFDREGFTKWCWKSFVGEQVTALLHHTGFVRGISQSPDQLVQKIEFYAGTMDAAERPSHPTTKPLTLSEVPPIAFSEAMRRLVRLTEATDMPEQEGP